MENKNIHLVAFSQALGITAYCALIALLFWRGNEWFGSVPNFAGPLLFLTLFTVSALICGLISLAYPILLGSKGKISEALKIVGFTAVWLVVFVLIIIVSRLAL